MYAIRSYYVLRGDELYAFVSETYFSNFKPGNTPMTIVNINFIISNLKT